MSNFTNRKGTICSQCEQQLEYIVCRWCYGKGFHRTWLIFKRKCYCCFGLGRVLRCPNESQHVIEARKRIQQGLITFSNRNIPNIRSNQKSIQLTNARSVSKSSAIPKIPPWHHASPNRSHPMHPQNPFSRLNPSSPNNPSNPMSPSNGMKAHNRLWRK